MRCDRTDCAKNTQHALQIAFSFADIFRAEILEHDTRDADLSGHTLSEEALARESCRDCNPEESRKKSIHKEPDKRIQQNETEVLKKYE